MTTNKPTPLYGPNGTIAYNADGSKAGPEIVGVVMRRDPSYTRPWIDSEPLIRLSDYEALQAKCDTLVKALEGLLSVIDESNIVSGYHPSVQTAEAALATLNRKG